MLVAMHERCIHQQHREMSTCRPIRFSSTAWEMEACRQVGSKKCNMLLVAKQKAEHLWTDLLLQRSMGDGGMEAAIAGLLRRLGHRIRLQPLAGIIQAQKGLLRLDHLPSFYRLDDKRDLRRISQPSAVTHLTVR